MPRDAQDLIRLFEDVFLESEGTRLVRGSGAPEYLPRDEAEAADRIYFAHGFFSSALHEVAHWCVAGGARRRMVDYGYWYKPDARTLDDQREFERVEVRPQALEWVFSVAAGIPFHFSADNLSEGGSATTETWAQFQAAVARQARAYAENGPPPRARRFATALAARYGTGESWKNPASYILKS